jgi:hypothetical protein
MLLRIPEPCTRRGFAGVANRVDKNMLKVRKSLVQGGVEFDDAMFIPQQKGPRVAQND